MKKKLATLLAAVMLTSMISTPVSAASYVSGTIGGQSVSGSLTMNDNSATASTYSSIQGPAGHTVSVTYTYGFGKETYTKYASASDPKPVTATAYSSHYGSESLSAAGTHGVYWGQYSWNETTSIKW
jgi:hypothetical protein